MTPLRQDLDNLVKQSSVIVKGSPTRYKLQSRKDTVRESEPFTKMYFGERDKDKPHKTILLVGETGTGKTTLINVMINYMLGVQRKDKVWFEITDDQSDRTSVYSQTSKITVYGFYLKESPDHLTIIDTPGYGDTHGINIDKEIAVSFLSLNKSKGGIQKIDAVCLVIMAHQNRLSDRQQYIFDAVQSLFGRDIAENIVLLFTHSDRLPPRNALMAVKEAGIKCAVNEKKNQPVFFLFNNCQSDAHDKEYEMIQEQTWDHSFREVEELFKFLEKINSKSLEMTQDVLRQREQLEAKISNLKSCVEKTELKQNELKQSQEALEGSTNENDNFEYEVEVPYKVNVVIDRSIEKTAMCCTVCKENCHYPGCWWISDLSLCSVMKDNHCTVCTDKCHYSKHVKAPTIYIIKIKKEKRTIESLKKQYEGKIETGMSLVKKLKEELQELEKEKIKYLQEAFQCVDRLQYISLNTESQFILQHADFLIEKLKKINEPEKVETLEDIKKRAGKKHTAAKFAKRSFKKTYKK